MGEAAIARSEAETGQPAILGTSSPTIAARLRMLVLASILPMWLLALTVIFAFDRTVRDERLRQAEEAGRLLMQTVDADLSVGFSALQVLANSPLIEDGDWRRVYGQAAALRTQQGALNVFVMSRDMQVQVSLDRPFGAPNVRLPFDRLPEVFARGIPEVSDRFVGAVLPEPLVSIGVPVQRQGAVVGRVEMVMKLARFESIVAQTTLPTGWSACLLDSRRQVIARSDPGEVDAPASSTRQLQVPECQADGPVIASRSGRWSIAMQRRPEADRSQLVQVQVPLALGALFMLAAGWLLARRLARGIAEPIQALIPPALAIGQGESVKIEPGGLRETRELAHALQAAEALLAKREQARSMADEAREASQARLAVALEAGSIGDWAFNPTSGRFEHSARHDQCYGHAKHMPRMTIEDFDAQVHPEDREAVRRGRHAAIAAGTMWRDEFRVTWPDGSLHWLAVRACCIGEGAEQGSLVGVVADVTDRREMSKLAGKRAELEMENRQLHTLIEQRNRFFASMSHELRTPLNAVIGLSELLLRTPSVPGETRQRYVEHIATAGRDLLALVNDVLDLGRAEAGRLVLRPERVELPPFCREVIELLRPIAQRRGITLNLSAAPDLPAVRLDPLRLRQILYNLLSNAVKFSPPDAPVLLRAAVTESGRLRFEVEDNGPGIPADQRERLFRDYEQLENGQAMGSLGTGLGLSLTRQLAALHGGDVWVRSADGGGSVFIVELPASLVI